MEEIKRVEYYHNNGETYRLNGTLFDRENIKAMTEHYQRKYAPLAAEINAQNGVLVMHLSHNENNGIRYAIEFFGISPETLKKIESLS